MKWNSGGDDESWGDAMYHNTTYKPYLIAAFSFSPRNILSTVNFFIFLVFLYRYAYIVYIVIDE